MYYDFSNYEYENMTKLQDISCEFQLRLSKVKAFKTFNTGNLAVLCEVKNDMTSEEDEEWEETEDEEFDDEGWE